MLTIKKEVSIWQLRDMFSTSMALEVIDKVIKHDKVEVFENLVFETFGDLPDVDSVPTIAP